MWWLKDVYQCSPTLSEEEKEVDIHAQPILKGRQTYTKISKGWFAILSAATVEAFCEGFHVVSSLFLFCYPCATRNFANKSVGWDQSCRGIYPQKSYIAEMGRREGSR